MLIDKDITVLVVDDSDSMRTTVKSILREIGFLNISEASDGIHALSQLKHGGIDVLISDWNMPNMDGITLVRMIRGDDALKNMIVLMVTAEADREHVVEAIKVGIDDYIVKPFTGDVLQKKLEKIFEKKPPRMP